MTLTANFELEGFEVAEASSAQQALEMLERDTFDLVLSDVQMPGMNGVDLYERIRALRPGLPVVLMTAFAAEDLLRRAQERGIYAVLPKPFAVEHALDTVRRAGRLPAVLVVDDAANVADSTAAALEAEGVRARAAYEAESALTLVRSGDVDVCVVDLVLGATDGAEVVHRILALDPTIRCIAISGHNVPDLLRRVVSAGAHTCMRKPVAIPDLVRTIAVVRSEDRGRAA
jgi:DNA-binding NtrC family response regulator